MRTHGAVVRCLHVTFVANPPPPFLLVTNAALASHSVFRLSSMVTLCCVFSTCVASMFIHGRSPGNNVLFSSRHIFRALAVSRVLLLHRSFYDAITVPIALLSLVLCLPFVPSEPSWTSALPLLLQHPRYLPHVTERSAASSRLWQRSHLFPFCIPGI